MEVTPEGRCRWIHGGFGLDGDVVHQSGMGQQVQTDRDSVFAVGLDW